MAQLIVDKTKCKKDGICEGECPIAIIKLKDGRIIIVAAHRLSTLKDFDHIVVLNKGTIIEQGAHEQLMLNRSLYYNLFSIQNYSSP